jgi:hypothetical protein
VTNSKEIPLAGASLEHLERRGTWLIVTLSAPDTGRVQLLFFNGEAHGTVASLPLVLATGTLDSPEGSLGATIPMPFPREGAVELHLQGTQGELLTIVGQALTVRSAEPSPVVVPLGRLPGGLR